MNHQDLFVDAPRQEKTRDKVLIFSIVVMVVLLGVYLLVVNGLFLTSGFCFDSGDRRAWRCFWLLNGIGLLPMFFLGAGVVILFLRRYWLAMIVAATPIFFVVVAYLSREWTSSWFDALWSFLIQ